MNQEILSKEWKPVKWVLEPSDPTLHWKEGWNEGGDAAVTAFIQHLLESGLLNEKDLNKLIPLDNYEHPEYDQGVGHNQAVKAIREYITKMKQ